MLQRLRKQKAEGGFTLIELLIVIVILGILAAIVVFAVGSARDDAETNSCKADQKTVNTAAEAYKAKNKTYPASVGQLVPSFLKATGTTGPFTGYSGGSAGACP